MPCRSCAERRKLIAEAVRDDGARGAVKLIPRVFRSIATRKTKASSDKRRNAEEHLRIAAVVRRLAPVAYGDNLVPAPVTFLDRQKNHLPNARDNDEIVASIRHSAVDLDLTVNHLISS